MPLIAPELMTSTTVNGLGLTAVVVVAVVAGAAPIAAATSALIAAGSTMLTSWPSMFS